MEEKNPYSSLTYIIELTSACNNKCHHCYNIWKHDNKSEIKKELTTEEWKRVFEKLKRETDAQIVAVSGGEPTLRPDFLELLDYIYNKLSIRPLLITNGSRLNKEFIASSMERGVRLFELPLLGPNKEIHNRISGNDTWDNIISAIVDIKSLMGKIYIVHVCTKENIGYFEDILKLAIALDTDGMLFNRFNPGGEGACYIDELLPSAEELEKALNIASEYSYSYRYPVSCGIAMPPCIIDMSKYPNLGTGYCGAGTERAYYTIGPDGNLRPCNHTSTILGNFLSEPFEDLINNDIMKDFKAALPPLCESCPIASQCQGGCKAAAQACYGSLRDVEPFIKKNFHRHPAYKENKV